MSILSTASRTLRKFGFRPLTLPIRLPELGIDLIACLLDTIPLNNQIEERLARSYSQNDQQQHNDHGQTGHQRIPAAPPHSSFRRTNMPSSHRRVFQVPLQIVRQLRSRPVATQRFLFQALQANCF